MRTLPKLNETKALRLARKRYLFRPRKSLNREDWITLRKHLLDNQSSLCAWCESIIDLESSHVDQIIPINKDANPTLRMENLVASCNDKNTCAKKRGRQLLPDWIHPYNTYDLQYQFHYDMVDGSITPSKEVPEERSDEAEEAITNQLNLNDSILKAKRARHMTLVTCYLIQGFSPDEIIEFLEGFPSLTRQLLS